MSSKIKVDSIETVSGSGTISIPTGNNLSVAGTSSFTGALTAADIRATAIKSSTGNTATTIANDGTVTFASPPTGAGSMIKLLDATISSSVANYDITSTHINSTYDDYLLITNLAPAADNNNLLMRIFIGGGLRTDSIYAYEVARTSSSSYNESNAESYFRLQLSGVGNATGENILVKIHLHNINSSNFAFNYTGMTNIFNTNGTHNGHSVTGSLLVTKVSDVVNGLRFYFNGGNIASGTVKLYGIK
tara:strand:+ start:3253 stop:3993 length:741 start_codon:yes stop_codon:yes gene_type:complete